MSERHVSFKEKAFRVGLSIGINALSFLGFNASRVNADSIITNTITDLPNHNISFKTDGRPVYFKFIKKECDEWGCYIEGDSPRGVIDTDIFNAAYFSDFNGNPVDILDQSETWDLRAPYYIHTTDIQFRGVDGTHFSYQWQPFTIDDSRATNPDTLVIDLSLSPGVTTNCSTHEVRSLPQVVEDPPRQCTLTSAGGGPHNITADWVELNGPMVVESGRQTISWNTDYQTFIPIAVR